MAQPQLVLGSTAPAYSPGMNWEPGDLVGGTYVSVEYSDDGGTTWATVRNGSQIAVTGINMSLNDYESPPNTNRMYRAYVYDPSFGIISAASNTPEAAAAVNGWWFKNPLDSTDAQEVNLIGNAMQITKPTSLTQQSVLGASYDIFTVDTTKGDILKLVADFLNYAAYEAFVTLYKKNVVVLIQSPGSRQWYAQFAGDLNPSLMNSIDDYYQATVTAVEQAMP